MRSTISFIILIAFVVLSCSKGGQLQEHSDHVSDFNDTTAPVIQINKPLPDQVFKNGETITIEGVVTDKGLYNGRIKITSNSNILIKDQVYEVHGLKSYNFSTTHVFAITIASDYTVTVEFQDHGLNNTIRTVKIRGVP